MTAFIVCIVIVALVLLSSLTGLLKKPQMPSQDVLDRVKKREQELAAQEKTEGEDRDL
jgi:hypothetical protein